MRVEGTYTFPGAVERVFAALTDPDALARAIPGCERFIQFGPATPAGDVAYETRVRLGQARQPYTVTLRVAGTRRPSYLKLDLRGYGASGPISGSGSFDLVAQDSHTVVAYRFTLTGPDLAEGSAMPTQAATFIARATCAHLADEIYAESEREPTRLGAAAAAVSGVTAPAAASDGASGRLVAPAEGARRLWTERAVWMGAGLALGLGALGLTLSIVRRMGGREGLEG